MTDDQLIESLRARTWPGDCEAAAFRLEELRARVAELEALPGNVLARQVEKLEAERDALAAELKSLREQEPLFWYRPVDDDGGYEGPMHNDSIIGKWIRDQRPGEWKELYARPVPVRRLTDEEIAEISIECAAQSPSDILFARAVEAVLFGDKSQSAESGYEND